MKLNVDPKSRLVAATALLSRLGVDIQAKSVSRNITKSRVKELEVLGQAEASSIMAVLDHLEAFDDVVREQVKEMRTAERYEIVRKNFKTILDDAERMVKQVSDDGKVGMVAKMQNRLMEWKRGSVESRFQEVRNTAEQVFADVDEQIQRELTILEAYREFRTALKESEVIAKILLERAETRKNEYTEKLTVAQASVEEAKARGAGVIEMGTLELARDQASYEFDTEDQRYQSALDLSQQLTIALGIGDAVMKKLEQTTEIKDAQQRKSATFYTANSGTLTALMSAFTSIKGLHEATQMQNAMVDGINDALNRMSTIGTTVQENAIKTTYGATVNAESLRKLFDSAVKFEENQRQMIEALRETSKKNDEEIRQVVEDGQRRMAQALTARVQQKGASLSNSVAVADHSTAIEIDLEEVSAATMANKKQNKAMAASVDEPAPPSTSISL